jgi:hypothetical protein
MDNKLRKFGGVILSALVLLGCAGREAHPVSTYQYGDEKKSCKALDMELTFTEEKIQRLIPETKKTGKNVGLGVAGAFLIVPWFFMDFTKSEQIEAEALRDRYNQLLVIGADKNCDFDREPIPEFKKSSETIQPSDTEE